MLRDLFVQRPSIAPEKVWLGGAVGSDGVMTVLYRGRPHGPVVGRRYVLADLAPMFGTADPGALADCVWAGEIAEPEEPGRLLDVDWAVGIIDDPGQVHWLASDEGR